MKNGVKFVSIGGCAEVGMNLYAYIYKDSWLLIDMGMGFGKALGQELIVPYSEVLEANKSKIKGLVITHSHEDHIGALPYIWPLLACPIYGRPFAIEMIRDKLSQFGLKNIAPIISAAPNKKFNIGEFGIEFIPVAHSTPESSAIAITTPSGVVIHSGDWRLDDDPVLGSKTDESTLTRYGNDGVLAFVCDSTNSIYEEQFSSEKEVRKHLIELVKQHKKRRVIITCFASNLARLESCYKAAKASNRQMVVLGRSLKKIEKVARNSGYFSDIPAFLSDTNLKSLDPAKTLIVCTGSQGEPRSALRKIANDAHKSVTLCPDDVVIFSSRVIPGNEKAVLGVQNALVEKGVKVIMDVNHTIHASGHPSAMELKQMYEWIRPNILIPIHGESVHLYRQAEIAQECGIKNVIVPKPGDVIRLAKNAPRVVENIPVEVLAVDGSRLIPVESALYRERESIAANGIISICVQIRGDDVHIVGLEHCGVFQKGKEDQLIKEIHSDLEDAIAKDSNGDYSKNNIKKIAQSVIFEMLYKRPTVIVHQVR